MKVLLDIPNNKATSLLRDLGQLISELKENPEKGTLPGRNCFKIKFVIKSKKKGKSGGVMNFPRVRDKFFENDKLPNDYTKPVGVIKNPACHAFAGLRKFEWMPFWAVIQKFSIFYAALIFWFFVSRLNYLKNSYEYERKSGILLGVKGLGDL